MTWNDTILQKLADWRPEPTGRQVLAIADEGFGWTVAITADRNDEVGCLLWEVTLRRTSAKGAESLQAWAEEIAGRVTGLVEPLKVIEVDLPRNEAMLRSARPHERAHQLYYFEVILKGTNEATLCRYQASHETGKTRAQVSAPLTHEVLARVIADLAGE